MEVEHMTRTILHRRSKGHVIAGTGVRRRDPDEESRQEAAPAPPPKP
jgi:hypothetical protein